MSKGSGDHIVKAGVEMSNTKSATPPESQHRVELQIYWVS